MRCSAIEKRLTEYTYGDLSDAEARLVESHLSGCPDCRRSVDEIRRVISLASELHDVNPPDGVYERLLGEVESGSLKRRLDSRGLWRPVPAYAAAAAIALFAIVSGVGTQVEVSRLERMNALLSDSLRILNSGSPGSSFVNPSDSITFTTAPAGETIYGD